MSDSTRKLISIVVPVLDEEKNIPRLYERVCRVMDSCADRYRWELVVTDNHSADNSFALLEALAAKDERVRAIRFSRNFGYQRSILTGYLKARGDAVVQLDCDMQDPPELIPEMLRLWDEENYQVVYGVRRTRREGWLVGVARKWFYRLIRMASEQELPLDAGDFRLVDRRLIEVLRQCNDAHPYLRGEIAAMGFRQKGLEYDRDSRVEGESKFGLKQMVNLGLDGVFNHSILPLRIASYAGAFLAFSAVLLTVGYSIVRILFGQSWPAGFTTIIVFLLTFQGMNSLFLGVLGEYVGRIYRQSRGQPMVIVEQQVGFSDTSEERSEGGRAA